MDRKIDSILRELERKLYQAQVYAKSLEERKQFRDWRALVIGCIELNSKAKK